MYVASVSLSLYLYDLIEVCWLELFHLCTTTGLRKEQVRQTVLQLFHCCSSELLRWHQFSRALALINTRHSQISISWTPSQCTKTQKAMVFCLFFLQSLRTLNSMSAQQTELRENTAISPTLVSGFSPHQSLELRRGPACITSPSSLSDLICKRRRYWRLGEKTNRRANSQTYKLKQNHRMAEPQASVPPLFSYP